MVNPDPPLDRIKTPLGTAEKNYTYNRANSSKILSADKKQEILHFGPVAQTSLKVK